MKRFLLVSFLCVNFLGVFAQDFWYHYSHIDSVRIREIVVKPSGEIFATVLKEYPSIQREGIRRSLDHGITWEDISPCGIIDPGLAVDSFGDLYVEGCDTIFKSMDNGDSWVPLFSKPPGILYATSIKTGYDSIVLMGGAILGAIVRSGDYGATWRIVQTFPLGSSQWVTDFVFSTNGVIYVTSVHPDIPNPTLFKSSDYGNTWTPIPTENIDCESFYSAAEDLNGHILLGSLNCGLYRFYDVDPPIFTRLTPYTIITGIVVNSDNKYYLSASDEGGPGYGGCIIFNSNDSTWVQENSGMSSRGNKGITVDENGNLITWGNDKIYRSTESIVTGGKNITKSLNSDISVYPNPCQEFLVLHKKNHPLVDNNFKVTILGPDGKIYFKDYCQLIDPVRINFQDFPQGLYCVLIENNNNKYIYRVIHLI